MEISPVRFGLFALLILNACASALAAPHARDVQPERPTVATHAGTVATGFAELETGVERDQVNPGAPSLQIPTLLKLGVAPRLQLGISVPVSRPAGSPLGMGDVGLDLKWRIAEGVRGLADVAVEPSVTLATDGTRGAGAASAGLLLINSHKFGPVEVDLNAGATWRGGDGARAPHTSTVWTFSTGGQAAGALGWVVEMFGYPGTGGVAGSRPTVAWLAGPTYLVRPELALDFGFIVPVSGPQPHAEYVGLVSNFGRFLPARK